MQFYNTGTPSKKSLQNQVNNIGILLVIETTFTVIMVAMVVSTLVFAIRDDNALSACNSLECEAPDLCTTRACINGQCQTLSTVPGCCDGATSKCVFKDAFYNFDTIAVDTLLTNDGNSGILINGCTVGNGFVTCPLSTSAFNNVNVAGTLTTNNVSSYNSGSILVQSPMFFQNPSVANYVPSSFNYYERTSAIITLSGPFSATNFTFQFGRIGNIIIMQWPLVVVSCTIASMSISAPSGSIPIRFLPSTTIYGTGILIESSTVGGVIQIQVMTAGGLQVFPTGSTYPSGGNCGFESGSVTYLI